MFVTLGQINQAVASSWSDQAENLESLVDGQQWPQVVVAATELSSKALKAHAIPVMVAATQIQGAAKALSDGAGDKAQALALALDGAVDTLVLAARREDVSTAPDRIRNEELLDKRLDEFDRNYAEWLKAHSGFMAIWDKVRGGADLTPFKATLDELKSKIELAPLTAEGRTRLVERHARLVAGLQPGDWKALVATGVGALMLNLVFANAGKVAASGAAVVYKKHQAKKKKAARSGDKPKKRKRKPREDEDESED